ncbi:PAS domain S-box protein [Chitinophaga agrisoli]|uniref:histidine kinase n=1 Tax=Chitinophaga agrisoli TaxID=2607653 RepID=A0A5B2VY85_9BACT|nr:ATP-binding protein [Chitinophaga agrisoli]KAA2243598.1 PAS domain S-box protein [Chitinophaga agrisoli]
METGKASYEELQQEISQLRAELEEANDTIEAIRTGQVDALIVQSENGHELYTLRSADQTYRVFIEKMTEGAVTINREGTILYSNSQFARMVGVPLSKVIGLAFAQFIAKGYKDQFGILQQKGWTEDCKGEVKLVNRDGGLTVQLSLTTLELDEGFSLSIIVTDLTGEKETQRKLKQQNDQLEKINYALELSNHDLQQFASVASHDLQEPLRKIQMFSSLLRNKTTNLPEDARMYLDKIIASSERMKQLINDVLNYSMLSSDQLKYEQIDLQRLLQELTEDYELIIQEKQVKLVFEELPAIEANKGQIRQLFQNIISNAIKFTRDHVQPHIVVSSRRINARSIDAHEQFDGPFCRISIKDNGIGFDEKYMANIFSLFGRLNSRDMYAGTGIGLAIARKIVEKHNGLITAHSIEGIGSEFIVVLPVARYKS